MGIGLRSLLRLALLTLTLSLAGPARAALIEMDWQAPGDGKLLHDDSTGLTWLDITETLNLSFNDVSAQLGPGGSFAGFRYATAAEVQGLMASVGFPTLPCCAGTSVGSAAALDIMAKLDPFFDAFGSIDLVAGNITLRRVFGTTGTPHETLAGLHYFGTLEYQINASFPFPFLSKVRTTDFVGDSDAATQRGSFLVQVPEPRVAGLALAGLLGLARCSRLGGRRA